MKKILFLPLLLLILFTGNAQEYFSSKYVSSTDSIADGYINVKYHNHSNPVKYTLVLGAIINGNDEFFDVMSDTVVQGDSIGNILISIAGILNQVPRSYEAFKAYAIDSITLDTLGVIKSREIDSYNEIGVSEINSSFSTSGCDGSFVIDTSSYRGNTSYGSMSNRLKYNQTYTSGSMYTVFQSNNQNNIFMFPDYEQDSLCPGYYEFASSQGFIVSFTIAGTSINHLTSNNVVVTETPNIECNNSALVTVNHSSGPYTYSWDGGLFEANNVNDELCSGYHNLRVANTNGDTVLLNPFIHTASFLVKSSTYLNCLGKAEVLIDSNQIDTTSFLYSWDNLSFSSEPYVDSLCVGNHTLSIINTNGDTLIQEFTIELFDFVISTDSDLGSCDGFAFVYHTSVLIDTVFYSWDGSLFSIYDNSLFNVCEGVHSLSMTGSILENDTLVIPFAVANSQNTYVNTSNNVADSISVFYETCLIDYSEVVDSVNITNLFYADSFNLSFEVEIWQSGILTLLTDTILSPVYDLNDLKVSFTIYCTQKSNSDVIKVIDFVKPSRGDFSNMVSNITSSNISIYPNPVSNVLIINTTLNEEEVIRLYNSSGQLVLVSKKNKLDLSSLPKGLYLLKYTSKSINEIVKVIKN